MPRKRTQTYRVYVVDKRSIMYLVDATSVQDARKQVEASDDADRDFGGKTLDGSEWYVDDVQLGE